MEVCCIGCKRKIKAIGQDEATEAHRAGRGRPVLCQACGRGLGLPGGPPDRDGAVHTSYRDRVFVRPRGCNVFIGQVTMETVRVAQPLSVVPMTPMSRRGEPGRTSVLVVDDDHDVRTVLSESFGAKGYHVHQADGADSAIRMVEDRRFDLVVLDVVLPQHTGFIVLERLRQLDVRRGIHTPVIMITGENRGEYRSLAERLDVAGFLTKPFPLQNLMMRSDEVLCA